MRYREVFDLEKFEHRVKLAKLLLDKTVSFTTKSVVLEFAD
ncbi:MAG: hypothetical protein QHH12_04770 [Candidatus Bathyarchaeota archaeon]|nr:hypothetical protein [Candidatus Bathyarchaeota archaeon]